MTDDVEVFVISTKQMGDEFQCQFSVGVQHFAIGPLYETKDEADWMGDQLAGAMAKVLTAFDVAGTIEGVPRLN